MGEKANIRLNSQTERKSKKKRAEGLISDLPVIDGELENEKEIESIEQHQSYDVTNKMNTPRSKRKNEEIEKETKKKRSKKLSKSEVREEKNRKKNETGKEKNDCQTNSNSLDALDEEKKLSPSIQNEEMPSSILKRYRKERKAELKAIRHHEPKVDEEKEELSPPSIPNEQEESSTARIKSKKERKAELRAARQLEANNSNTASDSYENGGNDISGHEKKLTIDKDGSNGESHKSKDEKKTPNSRAKKHKNTNITTLSENNTKSEASVSDNSMSTPSSDPTTATIAGSPRFIVFVGNLPYTATTETIKSHFSKLNPLSIRHLTKKDDPNQSRGMAFIEFTNYDTHKTALKIMHHSIFDDGKCEPRKINVELTAGGGGNTNSRKSKIKTKNERLNQQRIRRIHEEEKAKFSKETSCKSTESFSESNIHPSRRRMITT